MRTVAALLLAVALSPAAARADFVVTAELRGDQQTPPNASPAAGFASVVYDSASESLAYAITYNGLSAPLLMAHIHFGAPGVAGPIILPFANVPSDKSGVIVGILTEADFTPLAGLATFAEAVAAIQAGGTYVNLHTSAFADGEIRGQLVEFQAVPEPSGLALLGLGGIAVGAVARRRRVRP